MTELLPQLTPIANSKLPSYIYNNRKSDKSVDLVSTMPVH